MHVTSQSPILYFGTPVVLISTRNTDGTANLAPMSSAWWLGWRCVLGLSSRSKTTENMRRTGECVLNLPAASQAGAVDAISRTTGSDPMSPGKANKGYRTVFDKFAETELTPAASELVSPPRVDECPVQMEATLASATPLAAEETRSAGYAAVIEVCIERLHLDESILHAGDPDRVDPNAWRPLIMSFAQLYGLTPDTVHGSDLAKIPEHLYSRSGAGTMA